jgi:type IV secretion system protein VirB9
MPLMPLLAAATLALAAVQQAPAEPVQPTAQDESAMQQDAQPEPVEIVPQRAQAVPAPIAVQQAPPPPMLVQPVARHMPSDGRIQQLLYDPNRIVTLSVSPGFASVVELAEDERVENLVVGNSGAWQVTANRRGDRVIVKPLAGASPTNMVVLTASRRYMFMLDPFGETSFLMRFSYPQPVQQVAAAVAPETPYKMRGAKFLFPLAMYDDGRRTVIRWSAQHPLPAIFALNGGEERLINGRMVGQDFVIEGASPRYKFRYGGAEATAIRQTPKRRR